MCATDIQQADGGVIINKQDGGGGGGAAAAADTTWECMKTSLARGVSLWWVVGGILTLVGTVLLALNGPVLKERNDEKIKIDPSRDFARLQAGCTVVGVKSCFETVNYGSNSMNKKHCIESHSYLFSVSGTTREEEEGRNFTSRNETVYGTSFYQSQRESIRYVGTRSRGVCGAGNGDGGPNTGAEGCTIQFSADEEPAHRSTACTTSTFPSSCDWTPFEDPAPFLIGAAYPCWSPVDLASSSWSSYDVYPHSLYFGNPERIKLFDPTNEEDTERKKQAAQHYQSGIILVSVGASFLALGLLGCFFEIK